MEANDYEKLFIFPTKSAFCIVKLYNWQKKRKRVDCAYKI